MYLWRKDKTNHRGSSSDEAGASVGRHRSRKEKDEPSGRVKALDELFHLPHLYVLFRCILTHLGKMSVCALDNSTMVEDEGRKRVKKLELDSRILGSSVFGCESV